MLSIVNIQTISAQITCSFTRDLEVGSTGEDVRCLQKYLNANGFKIASSGVGSPGNETNLLRDLTKQAIIKWGNTSNRNIWFKISCKIFRTYKICSDTFSCSG
jgi:peptidoglycan hydrolase-like protein with peptidoglycan-binding domain